MRRHTQRIMILQGYSSLSVYRDSFLLCSCHYCIPFDKIRYPSIAACVDKCKRGQGQYNTKCQVPFHNNYLLSVIISSTSCAEDSPTTSSKNRSLSNLLKVITTNIIADTKPALSIDSKNNP